MKVMILCGGMGTRLREETEYRPKPMVEVGGRPIIWHIIKLFAFHGYREMILCLGYRGDMIKEYFLDYHSRNSDFTVNVGQDRSIVYHEPYEEQDLSVTLSNTGLDSFTGTRIRMAAKYLDDDDLFFLTYGDGLSNIDLSSLLEFHLSHGKLATITTIRPVSRFGMMNVNDHNLVSEFQEKPIGTSWASAGYMVLNKKVIDLIPKDINCMMEKEPLEKLAEAGELAAYKHEGFFFPMDTYRDYLKLNYLWNKKQAPWVVWDKEMQSGS